VTLVTDPLAGSGNIVIIRWVLQKRGTIMKKALVYVAIGFALAASIIATVAFEPQAAFACATGDCSAS